MTLKVTGTKISETLLTEELKKRFTVEVMNEDAAPGSPTEHFHKFMSKFTSRELEQILNDTGYKDSKILTSKFEKIVGENAIYTVTFKDEDRTTSKIYVSVKGLKLVAEF